MLSKTWRKENLYSLLVSVQTYTTTMESSVACPQKPQVTSTSILPRYTIPKTLYPSTETFLHPCSVLLNVQ